MEMVVEVMVITFAAILTGAMLTAREGKSRGLFGMMSMVLWFIAAAGIVAVENTYTWVVENSQNPGQYITEHGTAVVTSNWPISYLFFGFALLVLLFVFLAYIDAIKKWLFEPRRRRGGF